MPQLIVNADDFGYTAHINQGILAAHQRGIVSSTTVMVNMPHAPTGLEQALEEAPQLGLGLHINLTEGQPVSPAQRVTSLVDEDGRFFHIRRWPEVAARLESEDLYQEIAAQLERFQALIGRLPTHLDAHHHAAFLHPLALEATLTIAAEHNLPLRGFSPLDISAAEVVRLVRTAMSYLPEDFVADLAGELRAACQRSPAGYWPTYFENRFQSPTNTLGDLLNILTDVPRRPLPVELMCHPGLGDDADVWEPDLHQRELEALCHPAAREVIDRLGIELITFGALHRATP